MSDPDRIDVVEVLADLLRKPRWYVEAKLTAAQQRIDARESA